MQITLKHLIKFLPMDEKVRNTQLSKLDKYTNDQRYSLTMHLWSQFDELLKISAEKEFDKALLDVKKGKIHLENNLYIKIEEQIYNRFMRDISELQEEDEIEKLRNNLVTLTKAAKLKKIN